MWDGTLSYIARASMVGMVLWIIVDPILHGLTQRREREGAENVSKTLYSKLEEKKRENNRDLSGDISPLLKEIGVDVGNQQDSRRYFDYQVFTDENGMGVRAVPRLVQLKEISMVPGIYVVQKIKGDVRGNWYPEGVKHQSLLGLFGSEFR
ncbi:hypothetical protein SIID45300_03253 [Candidatus Magnetaquicoccaceae bacterium FCR-1]|uniref:Uncharacterized protein n=1 Tax=Candidatus Magnetaquiglobus chichijimensis TaxID=3141448 RepID=A0ABQ0CDD8_9PROT